MVGPTEWRPILSGEVEADAYAAIDEIAGALQAAESIEANHPSFAAGKSGIAVFFHYLAATGLAPASSELPALLLSQAVAAARPAGLGSGLFGGLAGVGWAVAHTQPPDVASRVLEEVDIGLRSVTDDAHSSDPFDLVGGLVGYGVYALERLPDDRAQSLLRAVVQRLSAVARRSDNGCWWGSRSDGAERANMGLAHGVPGVVSFLVSAYEAGVGGDAVAELAGDAVKWLLRQRLSGSTGAAFPYWVEAGREPEPARTAWCYGDPGVAIALLRAGRMLGRADWTHEAIAIAEAAARRPTPETGIVDCGLCHGSAGLAHIFNRFFHLTGRAVFVEVAEQWLAWTLAHRGESRGLAGFVTIESGSDGVIRPRPVPGFLTGVAGIGLALLAAVGRIEPAWDRVLLLSGLPSRVLDECPDRT